MANSKKKKSNAHKKASPQKRKSSQNSKVNPTAPTNLEEPIVGNIPAEEPQTFLTDEKTFDDEAVGIEEYPEAEEKESVEEPKPPFKAYSQATKRPSKPTTTRQAPTSRRKVKTRQKERELLEMQLPPHVSSWEIDDDPLNETGEIITLYADGEPATYIEITPENLEDMLSALNSAVIASGDTEPEVTAWTIRVPEDKDFAPLLSLVTHGAVLATLPLNETVLKELVPQLTKLYDPEGTKLNRFLRWAMRHKIISGILTVGFLAMLFYSIGNLISASN